MPTQSARHHFSYSGRAIGMQDLLGELRIEPELVDLVLAVRAAADQLEGLAERLGVERARALPGFLGGHLDRLLLVDPAEARWRRSPGSGTAGRWRSSPGTDLPHARWAAR